MKIVCTVSDQMWGGKHRYMADLVKALKEAGCSVTLVAEEGSEFAKRALKSGEDTVTVAKFCGEDRDEFSGFTDILRGLLPADVVITTGRRDTDGVYNALHNREDRPVWLMFRHSAFPLEPGSRTNAVLSMVDLIACTSLEQKREQFPVDSLKVDSDSVFVLTSSVSAETMAAIRAETKSGARARLGLPAEKMLFLSLNRLSWEKGVDRTIRALAAIDAELRELSHLVIVGGGPDEDALRALVVELELEDSVTFTGEMEDPSGALVAADALVLASTVPETGPLAVKEAMAAGLPVIVPRIGGLPSFVRDGQSGILFSDDGQLLRAMSELARDEALVAHLGSNAHDYATRVEVPTYRVRFLLSRLLQAIVRARPAYVAEGMLEWNGRVVVRPEKNGGFVYAERTSQMLTLSPEATAQVRVAVDADDPTLLASDQIDGQTIGHLVQMGALVMAGAA
ncbi:MAG: glycosyltransferase family 4 protein [Propionibacteriaceae bacterium]|nr:glycosyltransferase family 4 protein [Propionibacteriaceae bacterium]